MKISYALFKSSTHRVKKRVCGVRFTKFEAYPGMPTAKTSDEGVWLKAQRAKLPKYAEKDEAWAKNLQRWRKHA